MKKNDKGEKGYYPSKTYRIHPIFYNVFYACLTILERDDLSDYLIKKYFDYEDLPSLPNLPNGSYKGGLLVKMINDLNNAPEKIENMDYIFRDPRLVHIFYYYKEKGLYQNSQRRLFPIRVEPKIHDIIKELSYKTNTIGEVIELAIAYHIVQASETYYDLITFVLQHQEK